MRRLPVLAVLFAGVSVAALAASGPAFPPWGLSLSHIDKGVAPGNDFFVYGNGGWLKTATIPPDRSYAGVNLELNKQNEQRLMDIVADLHKKTAPTAEERKLLDLYDAFTDQAGLDAAGLSHAQADLDRIAKVQSLKD